MAKIALVTGASRGIGKSIALSLADKGLDVIITYRSGKEPAREVAGLIEEKGQKAATLQLDVSKTASYQSFVEQLKQALASTFQAKALHYLINNAGIGIGSPYVKTSEEQFDSLVTTNLKSVFFLTQHILPLMANGGGILNVSSALARKPLPGFAAYAATKGGIETLTRYQAKELGDRGIRVNVLSPGATATDFGGGELRENQDMRQFVASQTALGRVGEPEDVGKAAALLCTDEAGWITGQVIEASGGMFL